MLQVMEQFQAAREAKGPVRDQRPLCLNLDDHTRVCSIPKAKRANFRQLPGVVTHPDGERHSKCSVMVQIQLPRLLLPIATAQADACASCGRIISDASVLHGTCVQLNAVWHELVISVAQHDTALTARAQSLTRAHGVHCRHLLCGALACRHYS